MENNKPFFSVITCCYNSEKYLAKLLKSIREQTSKEFEHIIVYSDSTDSTYELLIKYKNSAHYPVKIINEPKKGVWHAFNTGIKFSKGYYIYHIESDNYLLDKNVLSDITKRIIELNYPDWVYGKFNVINASDYSLGEFPTWKIMHHYSYLLLKFVYYIPFEATFLKSSIHRKFGGYPLSYYAAGDYAYWLKIGKHVKAIYIDRTICYYRVHNGAISSNKMMKSRIAKEQLKLRLSYSNILEYPFQIMSQIIQHFTNKSYQD